jgi:threonine aldolase
MELNFRSDNESPAAAEIMQALVEANKGTAWSYAEDEWTNRLDSTFSELFETDTTVVPLATGTVANSIALACVTPPWGSVYCHAGAHIFRDESGAPEFFGNGLRLVPVFGENGKVDAQMLRQSIKQDAGHGVHSYAPSTFSMTQSTEAGTVYQVNETEALCDAAKEFSMATHMDGARFANALSSLGCSPAQATWRAGIDMLSFGTGKNGCMSAEALVFFNDSSLRDRAERFRKRSGHLLSKMRYVSAQLLRYIEDDLWLNLASNANRQATAFATAVDRHPDARLEYTPEANEIFVRWSEPGFNALGETGVQFLVWPGQSDLARFVFSYQTSDQETAELCRRFARL